MRQRILIIGAGFAGMWSALPARRLIQLTQRSATNVEVALIAPEPRLVVRPRLYEAHPETMSAPRSDLFNASDVRYIQGTVDAIRTTEHEVTAVDADGKQITNSYARLVLATGSHLKRPNIRGLDTYTFSVNTIQEATKLDAHLQTLASLPPSPSRDTVVVGGGGYTGIELAAELPARLRSILGKDSNVRIVIVERNTEIGPDLGPDPRPTILKALTELGLDMELEAAVESIGADSVVTSNGAVIPALTVVRTAGVEANDLARQVTGDKDIYGRLQVDQDLRVPADKEIFAAGDVAVAMADDQGHHTFMSCQHATLQGRSAGHNAAANFLNVERARPKCRDGIRRHCDVVLWCIAR